MAAFNYIISSRLPRISTMVMVVNDTDGSNSKMILKLLTVESRDPALRSALHVTVQKTGASSTFSERLFHLVHGSRQMGLLMFGTSHIIIRGPKRELSS